MSITPDPNVPPNAPTQERYPRYDFSNVSNQGTSLQDFSVHRYPIDLANAQDGVVEYPHYMMFFINVRKDDLSEMERNTAVAPVTFDNSSKNRVSSEGATRMTQAVKGAGNVLGSVLVTGEIGALATNFSRVGTVIGKFLPDIVSPEKLGRAVGSVFGLGLALTGTAAAENEQRTNRSTVTLKNAIALYLPTPPLSLYSAGWMHTELGIVGGMSEMVTDLVKGNTPDVSNLGKAGAAAILKGADQYRRTVLGNPGGVLSTVTGIAPNPFKAQLFTSMGFRQFQFDYTFLPRNEKEYAEVAQIIKLFRMYMHPVIEDTQKFLMKYPAEFTIGHYYQNAENKHLFRMSNCVLTSCAVKYGGDDFVTVRGTNGVPSEINMSLHFTELEMLTRDRIQEGF